MVLESRLAGWMAGDYADLKFWLDAPTEVRLARVAEREDTTVEAHRQRFHERAESEARRYEEYYNIDIEDRTIYDMVINTARWNPGTVVDVALAAAEAYDPAGDEGKTPVEGVTYEF